MNQRKFLFHSARNLAGSMLALLLCASIPTLQAQTDNRAPNVPDAIKVQDDNRVSFHAYAEGVQIYVCRNTGTTEIPVYAWVFSRPEAVLYDAEGNVVGLHHLITVPELNFTGPGWETESGSYVVGRRIAGVNVAGTIPWLLLQAVTNSGPGVLNGTTYIQRVNTAGGVAPTTGCDADHLGQEASVPYTAEYYFYRRQR